MLSPPNICYLDLSHNSLRQHLDGFFAHLEESLHHNTIPLAYLNIKCNAIGDDGAFNLAKMLCANQTLEELHIEDNGISLTGYTYIASAFTR